MKKEKPRVGVYICHCGLNIAGVVNVEEVRKATEKLPDVVTAKKHVYMCSQPGQALIKEDVEKLKLNRVVVASCSPRMHEPTFQKVLEEMGVNPFLFDMTNIREHVSWAHMKEAEMATEKATDLVRMAVARARLLEPIPKMVVPVTNRALIIGAGVAGINAAIDIAQRGFEVYLVEKAPYVGGHLALLNQLYEGGEASEVLKHLIDRLNDLDLKVFVDSNVTEVSGYIGNFNAKIVSRAQYVNEKCNLCRECEKFCPVSVSNETNFGLDQRKAIYLPFPNCYPPRYVIDAKTCTKCGECVKVCKRDAINLDDKPSEVNADIGLIVVTTGFDPYKPNGEFGYGQNKDVITQLMLERIMDRNGPTKGDLIKPSDYERPSTVVFILCAGSRQEVSEGKSEKEVNTYCSRFCCSSALKNVSLIKENYPETEIYVLYRDIRTFGRNQESLYRKCRDSGTIFIRYKPEDPPTVTERYGQLVVEVKDWLFNVRMEIKSDLVVLAEGMEPRSDAEEIRTVLSLTKSPDGFFQEAHAKMNPLDTFTDGVFIGGTAQGPKDIIDSVSQASGAAAKAMIHLSRGSVIIDLITAIVDRDLCTGCAKCVEVCPYSAIEFDEVEEMVKVTDVKCKGCGICSAKCPVGAVQLRHYMDWQIFAMVDGLFERALEGGE